MVLIAKLQHAGWSWDAACTSNLGDTQRRGQKQLQGPGGKIEPVNAAVTLQASTCRKSDASVASLFLAGWVLSISFLHVAFKKNGARLAAPHAHTVGPRPKLFGSKQRRSFWVRWSSDSDLSDDNRPDASSAPLKQQRYGGGPCMLLQQTEQHRPQTAIARSSSQQLPARSIANNEGDHVGQPNQAPSQTETRHCGSTRAVENAKRKYESWKTKRSV